jgi:hypothetical protein
MVYEAEPGARAGVPFSGRGLLNAIRRHPHACALAGIVLASLLFELHVARQCSLWIDELNTYVIVTRKPWADVLAGGSPEHPPLFFVLVKLVTDRFGASPMSMRALPLAFGCVQLVAAYWLCLELGLKRNRALVVTASFALAPFFVRHAAEARHYTLFPASATIAICCTFHCLREPARLRYLAGFAASAATMAATHYFGLAYGCALLGVLVAGLGPRWKSLGWTRKQTLAAGLILAGLLAVFAWVLAGAIDLARFYSKPRSTQGTLPWRDLLGAMADEFSFLGAVPWASYLEIGFAAAGLVLVGISQRGIARIVPAALAFAPCVSSLFVSSGHFMAARYLAPSWVLYHLGAMVALLALGDRLARTAAVVRPRLARTLVWAPFTGVLLLRIAEYPTEYGTGTDYYQGLQTYFIEHFQSDTALVTFDGLFGERIMGMMYRVGSPPIWLEKFRARRGVSRYVIAEIQADTPERQAKLERLVSLHFGLSPEAWRALPLLDLPRSEYQPAVVARVVVLKNGKAVVAAPEAKHPRHHRRHRRAEPDPES